MTESDIQNWITERLSEETGFNTKQILLTDSILDYDLDSLAQLTLIHDLELWLKVEIDPEIIVYEDTIEKLASWIKKQL